MLVLLFAFIIVGLINLCFYFGFFKFVFRSETTSQIEKAIPISVVICAKNEAENLQKFLPTILSQDHPNFEVVVINDASKDNTLEVIEAYQAKDSRVKIVNVQNNEAFWANKKYALTLGIKKAIHPYLLFTDADCAPKTNDWISVMASKFQGGKSIVLGYGAYFSEKTFLNKIIRFETLFTAIQYFSAAAWGRPYMGVGRNLGYTSEEFYNQTGFASHLHLRSGDDDLFVNQAATKENTAICANSAAITRSIPKKTFKEWFHQKRRHVSVAGQYKMTDRFLLGLFYISQLFFWIFFIILLFGNFWKIAIAVFALRIIVQGIVFYKAGKKFEEHGLIVFFPFLELFLVCAQLGIFISNIISKPKHWK